MTGLEFELLCEGLPVRQKPTRESFPSNAKAVKLWKEALPLANSGATARLLYNGLKDLNALEVEPIQRFEILELMRHPVSFVVSGMDKHIIGQPLPLPQQKKQIASVLRDFHRELSLGYRIVLADLCAPKGAVPFLRGKYAATSVARGIYHTGQQFLKSYLAYGEIPQHAWRDLHMFMAYAVTQHLHEKSVQDAHLKGLLITPQNLYLQAILLFITNPYRLTPKELADVENAALVWSFYTELRFDGGGEGVFAIDPLLDAPPGVRQEVERPWRLNASKAVHVIDELLNHASERTVVAKSKFGASPPLNIDLVKRLRHAWGFSGERRFQRLPAGHRMDTAIGLHAAHHLLAGDKDLNTFVHGLSAAVIVSDKERAAAWASASSEQSKPTVVSVRVVDQSLGGYRIIWENAQNLRARVGELVALSQLVEEGDDDPRDWLLGVIRWLKCGASESLEAGIELLSRQAEAVVVRSLSAATSSKVIHRALLLAPLALESPGEPTLLVPAVMDEREQAELLRMPDPMALKEYALCAPLSQVQLIENSGSYKHLGYQSELGLDPDAALPVGVERAPTQAELDAMWSSV
jgi:hypothetical protein